MTDVHRLRLVSSRPTTAAAPPQPSSARYRVNIDIRSSRCPEISVSDRSSGRVMLSWQGRVAQRILDMSALGLPTRACTLDCDKALMQRLAMAGAAARRQLGLEHDGSEPVRELPATRVANVGDDRGTNRWSSLHAIVAQLLEEFPKQHLAEEDIVCLMQFRLPCIPQRQVRAALSDLAEWNHVQQIRVPTGALHYDLDTRPHLHVFDAKTQQLRDAPESGVLQIKTS